YPGAQLPAVDLRILSRERAAPALASAAAQLDLEGGHADEFRIGDPRRGAARLDDHRRDVSTRRELDLQLSQAGRIEELVREAGAVWLPAAAGGCGPEREIAIAVGPKHAELVVGARRRVAERREAGG